MAVETSRLAGDVGGQLRSQFRVAIPRQLLGVSGDRGQRGAQLQRHLCGNLAMQLLLVADAFKFAAVADQASGSEQAAIDGGHGRDRDRDTKFAAGGSGVVGLELPALAALTQHRVDFFGEAPGRVSRVHRRRRRKSRANKSLRREKYLLRSCPREN